MDRSLQEIKKAVQEVILCGLFVGDENGQCPNSEMNLMRIRRISSSV